MWVMTGMSMLRSPALNPFHSSKWRIFLLGGSLTPLKWLRCPESLGLWTQVLGTDHSEANLGLGLGFRAMTGLICQGCDELPGD